ncbi:MAG: hypothetical protein CMJ21_06995 [Phycisphaerae bacterium]|nr:hypothetical protein [Phycisphaerae bacterium]
MSDPQHKIAVAGAAHGHVLTFAKEAAQVDGAGLVGLYDANAGVRQTAAQSLNVPEYDDLDALLACDPALVLIGAIPLQRVDLAIRAIEAGAAVLIDKPLAVTDADLDRVIAAQQKTGKTVMVFFPYRGAPEVLAAKQAIEQGRIGKLVRVFSCGPHKLNAPGRPAWHWTASDNGGALIDIGSHHVDICCWFANQSPQWISAQHGNFSQPDHNEFQDFAHGMMRFESGTLAYFEVDWLNPASMKYFGDTRLWLQGTAGKIEIRIGDEVSACIWTHEETQRPLDIGALPDATQWSTSQCEDLIHRRPTAISQDDVWRASRVSLRAFESAQAGGAPVTM